MKWSIFRLKIFKVYQLQSLRFKLVVKHRAKWLFSSECERSSVSSNSHKVSLLISLYPTIVL